MGWFSKAVKQVKRSVKQIGKEIARTPKNIENIAKMPIEAAENLYEGISGKAQAGAIAAAQAKAAEEARIARVRASQASQFSANDSDDQSGDVVLGTGEVDESLEEQLKRMRGK